MLRRLIGSIFLVLIASAVVSAQELGKLTVEKIMRDPKWIGTSPSNPFWNNDGTRLYFLWNPDKAPSDSLYYITANNRVPVKATAEEKQALSNQSNYSYNIGRNSAIYTQDGDVFLQDVKTGRIRRITQTVDPEFNPQFSFNETKIVYTRSQNLYSWDIENGETVQLTNFKSPEPPATGNNSRFGGGAQQGGGATQQELWLKNDQLQQFEVLRERKEKKDLADAYNKALPKKKELRTINLEDRSLQGVNISPDGRFVTYRLFRPASNAKGTIVPNYVTESGFTTDITGRTKVGAPLSTSEFFVFDRTKDVVISISLDTIPGIKDIPAFVKDYPKVFEERNKKPVNRQVSVGNPVWSQDGSYAVLDIRAIDNKDRWLMLLDTSTQKLCLLDRQHDDAWVGGPGTSGFGGGNTGWLNESTFWYRSEESGYSHLYTINVHTKEKKALTKGKFEVQQVQLSRDKKTFYLTTNEVHPGEQHLYRYNIADGTTEKLTSMTGAHQAFVSPDESRFAFLYSYSTKPWELYIQELAKGKNVKATAPIQITNKAQSAEFKSYQWKDPEVITFKASDGATVYARLYKPANADPAKPAVLFVHGAGYLQNAHKWWSSYFREYMFNNLLADNGYYVLDVDYRGSAGYGSDWRTGIYRFMGGKDLSDHVDAVNFLVKNYGINPKNVGLYGGSYGGFITLMGMFTEPNVFAAGAALRPVTDWAQYNHGYTANILNEPFTDSIAYRKSSPLYYASGLRGDLLICHGMVDVNVHYQDAIKLTQRLIELGKDNWELASYPMEDHGFVEPSSWTDEYKRIFKLFERVLKK